MSEWWTYRPEDFLLFSPRIYWRMFELHNEAMWPLHLIALTAGAVMLLALWRPHGHGLWIAFLLAALWGFVGWSFLWGRYTAINWAIAYVWPGFWLQAVLLAVVGATGALAFDRSDSAAWFGLSLALLAIVAYPLLPPLFGRHWASAEVFGIAPDPTAIATLGFLFFARGRLVLLLLPIPLLWLLLSGLTLHTMGDAQACLPLGVAGISFVLVALRRLLR